MSEYDLPEWAEAERRTLRADVLALSEKNIELNARVEQLTRERDEYKWMYDGLCK